MICAKTIFHQRVIYFHSSKILALKMPHTVSNSTENRIKSTFSFLTNFKSVKINCQLCHRIYNKSLRTVFLVGRQQLFLAMVHKRLDTRNRFVVLNLKENVQRYVTFRFCDCCAVHNNHNVHSSIVYSVHCHSLRSYLDLDFCHF